MTSFAGKNCLTFGKPDPLVRPFHSPPCSILRGLVVAERATAVTNDEPACNERYFCTTWLNLNEALSLST